MAKRTKFQLDSAARRRVLIVAYDQNSIREREQLLARNGYHVTLCGRLQSALKTIRNQGRDFDFLVVGYAVPELERLHLVEVYRDAHHSGQVILLYENRITNAHPAVAALLSVNGAQDNLLTAVRSLEHLLPLATATTDPAFQASRQKGGRKNG
jgi:DNA-binding NtrC family response regulator